MTETAEATLFANATYVRVWTVGLFCGVVRWLETLAYGVFAFDVTGSPAAVALLVILRFLPLALFGVPLGAVADRLNPLRLLILGIAGAAALEGAMLALFHWGDPGYWHVAAAAFLSGVFWASDMPFRRKMIGESVAPHRLGRAMALDGATGNGTRMVGPLIGGVIYQAGGVEGVFAIGLLLYLASLAAAIPIRHEIDPARFAAARMARPLAGAVEAARYALARPDIRRILAVTVAFNLWGFPYLAMVPVIGKQELGLSAGTIGALSALEGGFALAGALLVARLAQPRNFRLIYYAASLLHICVIFFIGVTATFWTLAAGLAIGGLCTAAFAALQVTLIYAVAPEEMRGRFLGLMTICIGAGVLGFANVGLTAEVAGGSGALIVIALEGLIPLLLIGWGWRELRPEAAAAL